MTYTQETLRQFIRTWVANEIGADLTDVIFANQGQHRPDLPYCVINLFMAAQRDVFLDETRKVAGDYKQVGSRLIPFELNIIGAGANELMSRLRDSIHREDIKYLFFEADIAVVDETGPSDLTAIMETKYQERSQLDITLRVNIENEINIVDAEVVEIDSNLPTAEEIIIGNN